MWLVTQYGIYSITNVLHPNGSLDPMIVAVWARRVDHLRNLQKRFPALESREITISKNRGYRRCRLFVPRLLWASTVAELEREQERWLLRREIMETEQDQDEMLL